MIKIHISKDTVINMNILINKKTRFNIKCYKKSINLLVKP